MNEPILVLGAGGFIGANVFKRLSLTHDTYGTMSSKKSWRLEASSKLIRVDLMRDTHLNWLLSEVKPKTIINCAAYGAYSFEKDITRIYQTNFVLVYRLLHQIRKDCIYVHAGTSSEYGFNCSGTKEDVKLTPNSDYAVSKAAASDLIEYCGKYLKYPCANMRLYSVYGPMEDSARLIPQVVAEGMNKRLPKFVGPYISRDFVYVDDVVDMLLLVAEALANDLRYYGESFNICSGKPVYIKRLVELATDIFSIEQLPEYTMEPREWDKVGRWYGNSDKTIDYFGWTPKISLRDGILKTAEWYRGIDSAVYSKSSKSLN